MIHLAIDADVGFQKIVFALLVGDPTLCEKDGRPVRPKRSGQLDQAVWSLEQALGRTPGDALLNYNLACYYSLAGRKLEALQRLKRAFDLDRNFRSMVANEPDFAPMKSDLGFRMLLAATA